MLNEHSLIKQYILVKRFGISKIEYIFDTNKNYYKLL